MERTEEIIENILWEECDTVLSKFTIPIILAEIKRRLNDTK